MRFVQRDGTWLLLDDRDGVLAVLRTEVDVVIFKRLCELRLAGEVVGFEVSHEGRRYRVKPLISEGGRLTLEVRSDDGVMRKIDTGFVPA